MGGRKKKKKRYVVFCYYCARDFDNEKVLIEHQRGKHFKCPICHRRLSSARGMMIHVFQVHKESIDAVPHAKKGRDSFELEIFGMVGVPQEMVQERLVKLYGEPAAKKQKIDHIPQNQRAMMPPLGGGRGMMPGFHQQPQPPMMGRGMPPPQFGMPPHGFNPNVGHMQGRPPPHQMGMPPPHYDNPNMPPHGHPGMPPPHYGNPNMPPHGHPGMPPPHMMRPPHQGGPHGGMPPQHHPGMGGPPPPQHHPGGPHGGGMGHPPPQHHPGMHQPGMGMPPQQQPGMMPPQIQQHPISNDAKVDVVARADHLIAQSTIMKKSSKKKIIRIYDRPGISMEEMRASNPRYAPQAH